MFVSKDVKRKLKRSRSKIGGCSNLGIFPLYIGAIPNGSGFVPLLFRRH